MGSIGKAAVVGAGTMGTGIASHLANAGVPVLLLDVADDSGGDRAAPAARALERALRASPPMFFDPGNAELVETGNVEDDLDRLAACDWIAEAIVERLDVKRDLYRRIDAVRAPASMVSSNTSTLPLSLLLAGMSPALRSDFCITHFFNPVRYMRLLELVAGPDTRPEVTASLAEFCDRSLGKGVVACRDTPGFLANRVGVFALQVATLEAAALGLTVEEADALMGRPMGIPKTGVFGLYDLIGLDLMLDVAESLASALGPEDPFQEVRDGIPLVRRLVDSGRAGRKSGAGFYRVREVAGEPVTEVVDLATGEYRPVCVPAIDAVRAGEREGLSALVRHGGPAGAFAWRVLARVLSYAASLVPDVADDPVPIDEAMKLGYNWTRGPFEMIDALGVARFRERLRADGRPVPPFLAAAPESGFYRAAGGALERLGGDGDFAPVVRGPGIVRLGDVARTTRRLAGNAAASLWNVGDGVACAEFHTKANALEPDSMVLLCEAVDVIAGRGMRALVLHCDAPHFSVGVNLGWVLDAAREGAWQRVDRMLLGFQSACRALKYAPFPVVGAPAGMALGGGFEVLMHCDAVQAHVNTVCGLVEPLVGLVPAGGGCKEILLRSLLGAQQPVAAIVAAATAIGRARTATSPHEARRQGLLLARDRSTMNRDRLLGEAKGRALALADGYAPPVPPAFSAPGDAGRSAVVDAFERLHAEGALAPHDLVVGRALADVLCGGDRGAGERIAEEEMYALERRAFVDLLATQETVARIEHMLTHGRPLRN